jgi:autoinducer 2-degrading protein
MKRIVRLTFKEEHVAQFLRFFQERQEAIRSVTGCEHVELWRDVSDPTTFYTFSLWKSEADLNAYRHSEFFKNTWSVVKPWFNLKPFAFSAHELPLT